MAKLPLTPEPPEVIRKRNRRRKNQSWWRSPEWKKLVKDTVQGKKCEECNKKEGDVYIGTTGKETKIKLTLDHPERWSYRSFEIYVSKYTPKRVVCTLCNGMFEKGLKICPICKSRYIHWRSEMCEKCKISLNPELKVLIHRAETDRKIRKNQEKRRKNSIIRRNRYPCIKRGLDQRCLRRSGEVCTFTAGKARTCKYFKERVIKTEEK